MNNPRRLGIGSPAFIAITLAGIFIVFGLCLLLVSSVIGGSGEKVESTQRRLIYATNPTLLMDACRQIAAGYASGGSVALDPNALSLPAIIHKVRPRTISVDDDRVTLECGTNVYRFGICVDLDTPSPTTSTAATTLPTTRSAPPMATRLLGPGVWYYAEDHAAPDP